MGFEWKEAGKAGINFRKHDHTRQGRDGRLLVVVYKWRGENIRIISARPAEAHEREKYEAE